MSAIADGTARRYVQPRTESRRRTAEASRTVNARRLTEAQQGWADVSALIRQKFSDDTSDADVAIKTGYRARGVTAIKNGEHDPSGPKLFAAMVAYPEVAARVEYWAGKFRQPEFSIVANHPDLRKEAERWYERMETPEFFEPETQREYHAFMQKLLKRAG